MSSTTHLTKQQAAQLANLIDDLMARTGLDTPELARRTRYSRSAVSLLRNGKRNLSRKMARSFAEVLGGTPDQWLQTYNTLQNDRTSPLAQAFDPPAPTPGNVIGFTFGRLVNKTLTTILTDPGNGYASIDPTRVGPASYTARLGRAGPPSRGKDRAATLETLATLDAPLRLMPGEARALATAEVFALPDNIEATVAPADPLVRKSVLIGCAAHLDPLYQGPVVAEIRNIGETPVEVTLTEPFLTLRFTRLPIPA